MSSASPTPTQSWRRQSRQFADELLRTVRLRKELAEKEIRHDRELATRFLRNGGAGILLALAGLPLLLNAATVGLESVTPLDHITWALILGGLLLIPGLLLLVRAIRRLRADFCGLHHTLAELTEDLVWLQEWTERRDTGQLADEATGARDA